MIISVNYTNFGKSTTREVYSKSYLLILSLEFRFLVVWPGYGFTWVLLKIALLISENLICKIKLKIKRLKPIHLLDFLYKFGCVD